MEENQKPNQSPAPEQGQEKFKIQQETQTKKKGLGPVKGLLLAIFIVLLICVLGLLIRMVVAGDNDYFKPIKDIFGIEAKEEKEPKSSNPAKTTVTSLKSAERYTLLLSDVNDDNVKHYRLTIDMKEFFDKLMKELNNEDFPLLEDSYEENEQSFNEDDFIFDDEEWDNDEYIFDEEYEDNNWEDEELPDLDASMSNFGSLEDYLGLYMMLLGQMGEFIDGEMYFDVYFEGNELVQVVIGYDYAKFIEKLYDYTVTEDPSSLEEEGINSLEDFANYMNNEFATILDEDVLYGVVMENYEDAEKQLKELGIKEKDIKDAIDFNVDTGLIEVYLNGTTKLKALISMGLESEGFQEQLKEIEKETKMKIDEDNIIESILVASNDSEEYEDFGFEFIQVK